MNKANKSMCHLDIELCLRDSESDDKKDPKEMIFSPREKPVFPKLIDVEKEKSVDETGENTTSSRKQ